MAAAASEQATGSISLSHAAVARAEWAQEFIYGAMTVVIVIAGLEVTSATERLGLTRAAAVIVVGAGATWAAHAFSSVIGKRLAGARTTPRDGLVAMRHAWPIIVAALPAAAAMVLASAGLWSARFAIDLSYAISILILGASGVAAGRATDLSVPRSIAWGLGTAAIGGVIVAVELWLHHG